MSKALRAGVALAGLGGFVVAGVALHELGHCVSWWVRGYRAPCTVTYAAPGETLPVHGEGSAWMEMVAHARVEGAPAASRWDHPVMWTVQLAAAGVLGVLAARWVDEG